MYGLEEILELGNPLLRHARTTYVGSMARVRHELLTRSCHDIDWCRTIGPVCVTLADDLSSEDEDEDAPIINDFPPGTFLDELSPWQKTEHGCSGVRVVGFPRAGASQYHDFC